MSAIAQIILLMRVKLQLPDRCNYPHMTDVAITTARSPASSTPVHSSTAVTEGDVPATIHHSNTMQELQSRTVRNDTANSYLQHLQPVNVGFARLWHRWTNFRLCLVKQSRVLGRRQNVDSEGGGVYSYIHVFPD